MNMDLEGRASSDYDVSALLYAQHYAETQRKPKPEMTQRLYNDYGREKADDIMLIIPSLLYLKMKKNKFEFAKPYGESHARKKIVRSGQFCV